jgi:tetratricopeptide (TPR) repeat protein
MKLKPLVIAVLLAVLVQGLGFSKGIAEEGAAIDYDTLVEQADACLETGDYAAAIPLFKRMHELKPGELASVEYLGILYTILPELNNALFWLAEAEKRGSSNNLVYYNLACVYSLKENMEKAEEAMNKALALGYSNFEWMNQDDDLVNFRTGTWWEGMVDTYALIEQQLASFDEFLTGETGESDTDRITFSGNIVSVLKELAPHIPALCRLPLSILASSYNAMENYDLAEQYYLEVKAIIEQVLGKNHPVYAATLTSLGGLYTAVGDNAQAESYYLQALRIWEQVLGKDHPDYAQSLDNLGLLYYNAGDYAQSESYYRQALGIWERTLGKEHPNYARSLNNRGLLYYNTGDYAQSESYYLQALGIWERTLGKEHPNYATSLSNLGLLYYNAGNYAQSESYYLQALGIWEQALGKDHPNYALSLNNLGELY